MIQHCINHLSHSESFNVVQIIQLIQRSTNHSTSYKSFNVVQIIQRSTNHST